MQTQPLANVFFDDYFAELGDRLRDASTEQLEALSRMLTGARERGRKVILAGNGASAAIASHVAVDLTKNCGVRAITFNEADLITCFANDYGYDQWLAKAIDFYGDRDDLALLVSCSGKSPSVVNAADAARERGLAVVTLSGFQPDNPLRGRGDLNLWVNSRTYNIVEATHQSWLLAVIDNIACVGAVS